MAKILIRTKKSFNVLTGNYIQRWEKYQKRSNGQPLMNHDIYSFKNIS